MQVIAGISKGKTKNVIIKDIPEEVYLEYKSILARKDVSIKEDIINYMSEKIKK